MPKQKWHINRSGFTCVLRNAALASVVWSLLSAPALAQFGDDESFIEVECYRASSSPRERILVDMGHVSVSPDRQPAAACNVANYSCHNQCFACVYDYDYSADVCVDIAGNTFLK